MARSAAKPKKRSQKAKKDAAPAPAKATIGAMTPVDLARVLSAAGNRKIEPAMIEADIAAGAPANADGTLNLLHYAAWLAQMEAK